jgi:opacity protein-like surface antigen
MAMRIMFVLAISAITSLPFAAQAAVSDDLVFCSKLTSPRERIACYDAAARIAANQLPRSAALQPVPNKSAIVTREVADKALPPVYAPVVDRNRFDGFYAAIGGAYGWSANRAVSFVDNVACFNTSCVGASNASGWSAQAAAGYSITFGRGLMGLEVDGRWGKERGGAAGSNDGSAFVILPGPPFFAIVPVNTRWSHDMQVSGGVHVSARAGIVADNLLIYAKAGVGAARVEETFTLSQTPPVAGVSPGGIISSAAWLPTGLLGVGAEYNLGSFFARGFVEAETVGLGRRTGPITVNSFGYSTDAEPFWIARAGAMLGARF